MQRNPVSKPSHPEPVSILRLALEASPPTAMDATVLLSSSETAALVASLSRRDLRNLTLAALGDALEEALSALRDDY